MFGRQFTRAGRRARCQRLLAVFGLLVAPLLLAPTTGAAEQLAIDGRVEPALERMAGSPNTSDLRDVLATRGVGIQFVPMTPGLYARYSVARRAIEIDERWAGSEQDTLAAVIIHEAVHAQDAEDGFLSSGGSAACIDSEIRAFRTSALFWTSVYPLGKVSPANDLERQLNLIADRQQRDPQGLEHLVRQAYTDQCGSG